jgi:GNAT superfamily N-acetyltransferase
LAGVACWLPPGNTMVTTGRMLRGGMAVAPPRVWPAGLRFGLTGSRRLGAMTAYMDGVHQRRAPGPHWYLWAFGVEPSRQGRGLGGGLLGSVLARGRRWAALLSGDAQRAQPAVLREARFRAGRHRRCARHPGLGDAQGAARLSVTAGGHTPNGYSSGRDG